MELAFTDAHRERMHALAEKNRRGELTEDEAAELDLFCEVGTLLSILKVRSKRMIHRERLPNGGLVLRASGSSYEIHRPSPGVLFLKIAGSETGELGRAPLGEVAAEAAHHPPLRLFIDMTGLTGIAPAVSEDWTAWFKANQPSLAKVHALVASELVQLTVTVSQLFSRTGNLIRVHTEPSSFEAALAEVAPGFKRRRPV